MEEANGLSLVATHRREWSAHALLLYEPSLELTADHVNLSIHSLLQHTWRR